jgi:hypothetical protein
MGGKALNRFGVFTERKNTSEFWRIANEIQDAIRFEFDFPVEMSVVECYRTKEDHGDLDLLIKIDNNFHQNCPDLREFIRIVFAPHAINYNGGVVSFDYQNFQIDFIPIRESKWETAKVYYSFDPLGNIMGKTYHKFGLSYGWDGLFYKFRNFNGRNSSNILISTDPRKIFEFGDYDYDRYLKGFDTLEEIFEFVIKSKYFDSDIFQMENLKHIDKKRNRKRGSYHVFLKYINDKGIKTNYGFHKDKDLYLPMIDEFFPEPDLMGQLYELEIKDRENKILSQKFNGDMVMSWLPKLMGKELGNAITKFRDALGDEYRSFVLNSDYNAIRERFMEVYYDEN